MNAAPLSVIIKIKTSLIDYRIYLKQTQLAAKQKAAQHADFVISNCSFSNGKIIDLSQGSFKLE